MKVVITGKGGQLACELQRMSPEKYDVICVGKSELDITNRFLVTSFITKIKPDLVINAAAYTYVDKAENESELAYQVNETGVINLAEACKSIDARLFHISTDFVFNGSNTLPYAIESLPDPINVYGASKLAGEVSLREILPTNHVIVRTAWVYSVYGNNFVKSMLRLMTIKTQLEVISDQVGTPTWANGLAKYLWLLATKSNDSGTYHWTDAGVASWYDFAIAIQDLGIEKGILDNKIPIVSIDSSQYPMVARRPSYSVLKKNSDFVISPLKSVHWRRQLSKMMDEL